MDFWFSSVGADPGQTASDVVRMMLQFEPPFYALGVDTPNRYQMAKNDKLCIYATFEGGGPGGVVADATIDESPDDWRLAQGIHEVIKPKGQARADALRPLWEFLDRSVHAKQFPVIVLLRDVHEYIARPIHVTPELHKSLDSYALAPDLGLYVSATKRITERDFGVLTGGSK
jgi:hypothetical protein